MFWRTRWSLPPGVLSAFRRLIGTNEGKGIWIPSNVRYVTSMKEKSSFLGLKTFGCTIVLPWHWHSVVLLTSFISVEQLWRLFREAQNNFLLRSIVLSCSQGMEFYYFCYWKLVRNVSTYLPTELHSRGFRTSQLLNYTQFPRSRCFRTSHIYQKSHSNRTTVTSTELHSRCFRTSHIYQKSHSNRTTVTSTELHSRGFRTSQLLN
jgi:hypothetical protein